MIRIFLSYARVDEEHAVRVYKYLNMIPRVDVWFDRENILPGQDWENEIEIGINSCHYFLALYSSRSCRKRGYVQKELRKSIDIMKGIPEGEIFFIPARLDECDAPFRSLMAIQYIDLFPDMRKGLVKIERAIKSHVVLRNDMSSLLHYSPDNVIRFKTHIARFISSIDLFYFITVTNISELPIEITHVWYEDIDHHLSARPQERPLPRRLQPNEIWETWLSYNRIPEETRDNAYGAFRVRLSSGDIFASAKDDSVPPFGTVPGG